jgi:hypothetical protein
VGQQPGVVLRGHRAQDQAFRRQDVAHGRQVTGQEQDDRQAVTRATSTAVSHSYPTFRISLDRVG